MKLEAIHAEWEVDSRIDETEIVREEGRIPLLHAKYLRLLSEERMLKRKLEEDLRVMEADVADRLTGVMSQEDLESRGWSPERRRYLRSEVSPAVQVDPQVVELKLRVALQAEKVDVLDSIVRSIMNRNFILKGMIDWIKFRSGAL